jgi:hypothetical protein
VLLFRSGNPVRIIPAAPRRESARAASVVAVRVVLVLVFGGERRRGVLLVDRSCLLIHLRRIWNRAMRLRRQLQQRQLRLWPLRRKDKQEQNELLLLIPLVVRASGGIGSPARAESNSHVCQCVTGPA